MNVVIANVQISCPPTERAVQGLAALYGELLGMEPVHIGYQKLVHDDGRLPEIGFETWDDDTPPRWPDPDYPQQIHLDVEVGDLAVAEAVVLRHGATGLRDHGAYRIYADLVGHPFCLYENRDLPPVPGRLVRIVLDCFSPRALARFYQQLLELPHRLHDTPERVVIAGSGDGPALAFQHAQFPAARWPDPAFPEQLHLDLTIDEDDAPAQLEALGAIRLHNEARPDALVFADPASHPFCVGIGPPGPSGPGQVEAFAAMYGNSRIEPRPRPSEIPGRPGRSRRRCSGPGA